MAQRPVEKHYGTRTLQERDDGYLQMAIPRSVVDDPKIGLEAGQTVTVRGIIVNGETYIRIEGAGDE